MSHLDFREKTSTPFDGDIYADDDPVTRGVTLATTVQLSASNAGPAWGKEYADWGLEGAEPKIFLHGTQPISLPIEDLPRNALATVAGASPTAVAEAVLAFFRASCDAVVQVDKATGAVDVDLRVAYELLRLSLRFCAVRGAAQHDGGRVAAVWQREAGDGVEFLRTVRECTEFLVTQGLGAKLVHGGSTGGVRAALAAPFDVTPPVSPNGSLARSLGEEPATPEDMEPLLMLAADPDPRARCEALAAMCRIFDDELDAGTLAEVLAPQADVVFGWVADPALELCAPALARKLAAQDALAASSLVPVLLRALEARAGGPAAKEGTPLGTRQLAWALAEVAASGVEPEPTWGDLTSQMVVAHSDDATRRYLMEAQIALRA